MSTPKVKIVGRFNDLKANEMVFQLSCGCDARLSELTVLSMSKEASPRTFTDAFRALLENHACAPQALPSERKELMEGPQHGTD